MNIELYIFNKSQWTIKKNNWTWIPMGIHTYHCHSIPPPVSRSHAPPPPKKKKEEHPTSTGRFFFFQSMKPHVWLTQIGMTIISAAPILRDPAMEKKKHPVQRFRWAVVSCFLVCLFVFLLQVFIGRGSNSFWWRRLRWFRLSRVENSIWERKDRDPPDCSQLASCHKSKWNKKTTTIGMIFKLQTRQLMR